MTKPSTDLLVAAPALRTEIRIGYARVSTGGQKPDRQIDALTAPGCRRIFADKRSGRNVARSELQACHAFLTAGDALVVPSLDRYGRSLQDLVNMVAELRRQGAGFTSLHEALDTTTPGGRLIFHVFAALAEFIRELIVRGGRLDSRGDGQDQEGPERPVDRDRGTRETLGERSVPSPVRGRGWAASQLRTPAYRPSRRAPSRRRPTPRVTPGRGRLARPRRAGRLGA